MHHHTTPSSTQAQSTLVRSFKRLRGDDATPGSHSAYRITVRQLEALVRLSEGMARVYLSPSVTGEHVAEVSAGRAAMYGQLYCHGDARPWQLTAAAVPGLRMSAM
jgi:hypothetical protein